MPDRPVQLERPRQLIVEGKDAKDFFEALAEKLDLADVQVQNFGGVTELWSFLKGLRLAPKFNRVQSLGIVRDAEANPTGAFQSARDALANAELAAPKAPEQREGKHPTTSILILPDAVTAGMLEDLCLRAIADRSITQCIDGFFKCVDTTGPLPKNMSKARACAYLASCTEAKPSVGIAARAGYWPLDHPAFEHVRTFLMRL